MIWCIKCGCSTFRQEVTLKADVVYEVEFDDESASIRQKDLQDSYEYDHVQEKPFECKKCGTPLVDENGIPLVAKPDIIAWATRMKAELEQAADRLFQEQRGRYK